MPAMRAARALAFSLLAVCAVVVFGLAVAVADPMGDCNPRPVKREGFLSQLRTATASATSCAPLIRVDGHDYGPSAGRWLDEGALVLQEYGPITHASWSFAEPVAYALEGVDPTQLLVMKTAPGKEDWGAFTLLLGGDRRQLPSQVCGYADSTDEWYPSDDCPIAVGRRYLAEMKTSCGLDEVFGPYGGHYWRVIDPPRRVPRAMSNKTAHGTVELLPEGRLRFKSNGGAVLFLETTSDAFRWCRR
jgi:hypothetical protein